MTMGQIMKMLERTSSLNFYSVTLKMLRDNNNNSVDLPESYEVIEKVKSICDKISITKKNSISSKQAYLLLEFVANNLSVYGDTSNEKNVKSLYNSLL
ncbi:hypothetical protein G9F71_000945 [Clostridium sp. FP2]|uniref:hypothetical protein n=1 Tax=Clostridium sp. FP2 TaxID=2724481 RepID=UPI0013E97C0E|nr:hypothetical protein [Clostridium sp. FP2]MBZ9621459.1 hypothetical protein [Clostridium sp. FP2]